MTRYSSLLAIAIASLLGSAAVAQVTGDGVADFYYFSDDGIFVETSLGNITRPAGTMLVDTDGGIDLVAMFIKGPDVTSASIMGSAGCFLCDTMQLPVGDLGNEATYTVGFSAESTQWIRTDPTSGVRGFLGVISDQYLNVDNADAATAWPADAPPFVDFPDAGTGLAMYEPGLTDADFPRTFPDPNDPNGQTFSVIVAPNAGGSFGLNVTVLQIPEPSSIGLLSVAVLGLLALRRRR